VVRGPSGGDGAAFARAQSAVLALQGSVSNIPLLQAVFDASGSSPAILVCARCLQHLLSEHWNEFTVAQKVAIRDYLLQLLGTRGPSLEDFAVKAVVALVCRLTKFGWFDEGEGMRRLVAEAPRFLQETVAHCVIGLRLLHDLVAEMNYKNKNRTMTQHRKVAVAFRDAALLPIFESALTMLNQVATRAIALDGLPPAEAARVEDKIMEEALQLLVACLSFDFVGSNPDEDVADTSSIQVPASWRERLQSGSTLRVLFNLYKGCTTGKIPIFVDA